MPMLLVMACVPVIAAAVVLGRGLLKMATLVMKLRQGALGRRLLTGSTICRESTAKGLAFAWYAQHLRSEDY